MIGSFSILKKRKFIPFKKRLFSRSDSVPQTFQDHPLPGIQSQVRQVQGVIIHKLIGGISPEEILNYLFDTLGSLLPYDRIGIATLEQNNSVARVFWVKSKAPVSNIKNNYSASLKGSSSPVCWQNTCIHL